MSVPEEVPREVWVPRLAAWTIAEHQEARCPRCREDGCRSLDWARDRLERYATPTPGQS